MKKQIISALFISCASFGFGQNPWSGTLLTGDSYRTGNVGIGVNPPLEKLHVVGTVRVNGTSGDNGVRLFKDGSDGFSSHLYLANSGNDKAFNFQVNSNSSTYPTSLNLWAFTSGPGWSNRFTFTQAGALGIGTTTPVDQLHVIGGIRSYKDGSGTINPQLYLGNAANNKAFSFQLNADGSGLDLWTYGGGWNKQFTFNNYGNLGIGTASPYAYLHVCTPNNSGTGLIVEQKYTSPYAVGALIKTWNDYSTAFQIQLNGATIPHVFKVQGNGQTIIGGTIPSNHTDALLAVGGKIVCREAVVTISNWADFVFANDYKLPPLKEVEAFYLANNHLPEIPSAKEVQDKGIDVGEMNKLLLQKIEELTMYVVEQQKQIDELKKKSNK